MSEYNDNGMQSIKADTDELLCEIEKIRREIILTSLELVIAIEPRPLIRWLLCRLNRRIVRGRAAVEDSSRRLWRLLGSRGKTPPQVPF